ncbi:MAG TPA: RluA family pseudouridine synthase [Saprospiraceae bacterium]|nr:RluA family pseudouridine synthase [Saprospiraceae bacterium]HND87709.1 RluA family pseudouridine synthase [Saprospiraceae bacterium]
MLPTPTILYEDNHLLVLNKPPGWLVQGDRTGDPTLSDWGKDYLKHKYSKPGAVFLHPVHRIDRPVSGAVLLARTDKALSRLTELFRRQQVHKTYWALTEKAPRPQADTLRHHLLKDEQRNVVKAFAEARAGSKESLTRYEWAGQVGRLHLLQVQPLTGRPHQIRVQLAAIGCPIVGDLKYGAAAPLPDASIGLHCRSMQFEHPVQRIPMHVLAPPPPADWWALLP